MHPSHDILGHITLDNACRDYVRCMMAYVMSGKAQRSLNQQTTYSTYELCNIHATQWLY